MYCGCEAAHCSAGFTTKGFDQKHATVGVLWMRGSTLQCSNAPQPIEMFELQLKHLSTVLHTMSNICHLLWMSAEPGRKTYATMVRASIVSWVQPQK